MSRSVSSPSGPVLLPPLPAGEGGWGGEVFAHFAFTVTSVGLLSPLFAGS